MKGILFGKGSYGKGKGSYTGKGYSLQYNAGTYQKGKEYGPRTPFYGDSKGCGVKGHTVFRCPELGKGFKGDC